jgi:hypothetical protein
MKLSATITLLSAAHVVNALGHVVPGQVFPTYPQTWGMKNSSIAMVCNNSGPVDAEFAARWVSERETARFSCARACV